MKNLILVLFTLFSLQVLAAETAITPVTPNETANEAATATSDGVNGNSVQNPAGDVILVIFNTTASSAVATVNVQNSSVTLPGAGAVTKASVSCNLAAGENCVVGPFAPLFWNDGNSNLLLSYTGDSSSALTVMAIKP